MILRISASTRLASKLSHGKSEIFQCSLFTTFPLLLRLFFPCVHIPYNLGQLGQRKVPNQYAGCQVPENLPLVIIGGNSLVAPYLMRRLAEEGRVANVISRSTVEVPEGFTFTEVDLDRARNWIAPENAVIISLLPLWVLTHYLPRFIGVKSIIALGSTSLFSKAGSTDERERSTALGLEAAEKSFQDWCVRSNVHGTLLRPTMIYDGVNDHNIGRMVRFIRRFHFLPLARPAEGRRQPIHADDVAKAIQKAIGNMAVYDKTLNIAGGEILTYRAMAERVFMRAFPKTTSS